MLTALYAGLLAMMYVFLTLFVVQGRWSFRVGIGDGGHHVLNKRIRIHGNFAENVPLALLLMFLNENLGASSQWLHIFGVALLLGRVGHFVGIVKTSRPSAPRFLGVLLTLGVLITGGLRLLILSLG